MYILGVCLNIPYASKFIVIAIRCKYKFVVIASFNSYKLLKIVLQNMMKLGVVLLLLTKNKKYYNNLSNGN